MLILCILLTFLSCSGSDGVMLDWTVFSSESASAFAFQWLSIQLELSRTSKWTNGIQTFKTGKFEAGCWDTI